MELFNNLPLTKIKIFIGKILYKIIHLVFQNDKKIIIRNGIKYEINLSEGIDLSFFLFGGFQRHVWHNKNVAIPKNAVILDVGANSGLICLQLAKQAPLGKVYAFEPTFYAFEKLKKNLELNPQLAEHIVATQTFVSEKTSSKTSLKAYSSWKVAGASDGIVHNVHGGIQKSVDGIGMISIDDFCGKTEINRLDFIKIDTDGHEFSVLKGAEKIIRKFRPYIIFEAGLYMWIEQGITFENFQSFFETLNYDLFDSSNCKKITRLNYSSFVPAKGTIDILALPAEKIK